MYPALKIGEMGKVVTKMLSSPGKRKKKKKEKKKKKKVVH